MVIKLFGLWIKIIKAKLPNTQKGSNHRRDQQPLDEVGPSASELPMIGVIE